MATVQVDLDEELVPMLHRGNQTVERGAREVIVLELYRRGSISSGKAANALGMARVEFIQHASRLGIPYFALSREEWAAERALLKER